MIFGIIVFAFLLSLAVIMAYNDSGGSARLIIFAALICQLLALIYPNLGRGWF